MSEQEQLAALCRRLGAGDAQAATIAAQLLKRADQLAAERSIGRTEALRYLVDLMIKARTGGSTGPGAETAGNDS